MTEIGFAAPGRDTSEPEFALGDIVGLRIGSPCMTVVEVGVEVVEVFWLAMDGTPQRECLPPQALKPK